MELRMTNQKWDNNYALAKQYYEENGHLWNGPKLIING